MRRLVKQRCDVRCLECVAVAAVSRDVYSFLLFVKQKTAYELLRSLVGSEMCIRDSPQPERVLAVAGQEGEVVDVPIAVDRPIHPLRICLSLIHI